jgi:hypothetical protein
MVRRPNSSSSIQDHQKAALRIQIQNKTLSGRLCPFKGLVRSISKSAPPFSFYSVYTTMAKIRSIEYFRVKPRWLFVLIKDDAGGHGWGEATLEGHSLAVEGALDEMIVRLIGYEAESVSSSV